jgi:NAD(P)H-flavin reductase
VIEVEYELADQTDFIPGQFANIEVTKPFRRPYSILEMSGNKAKFIIEVRNPGRGSDFFRDAEIGTQSEVLLPLGRFVLHESNNPKVFISIGAGIAPFISMIKSLIKNQDNSEIHLFQGMRIAGDDLATAYLKDQLSKINLHRCITREEVISEKDFKGRVTEIVPTFDFDYTNTDFYVCGSNEMVKEMRLILQMKGAENILIENYG